MKKDRSARTILMVTFYLITYITLLYFKATFPVAMLMFAFSPFVLTWMVLSVLKNGIPGKKTFEKYRYEDTEF